MDQGLSAMDGVKAVRNVHAPRAPHQVPVAGAQGALRAVPKATATDTTLTVASSVREAANLPFMLMMPAALFGWAANKLKFHRASTVLRTVGDFDLLRRTNLSNAFQAPADMLKIAAEKAELTGGKAAAWVTPLTERSNALRVRGDAMGETVGKAVKPLVNGVSSALKTVNLHAPAKTVLTYLGKAPIGAGVAAIAATAGIAVIWGKRSKEKTAHAQVLDDMRTTLGDTHPLVAAATTAHGKQISGSRTGSVLESAGELAFVGMELNPHMSAMAAVPMVMAQMGLNSAAQIFVNENMVADAWARAKQPNADAKEKVYAYSQLIGALPQAQQHGGPRNQAALGLAQLLVKKHASFDEVVAILREPAKFEALAKEFMEAQQAAAPAQPAAAAATAQHPVMHGAVPVAKITSSVHHDGHVKPTVAKVSTQPAAHAGHVARVDAHAAEPAHVGRLA